MLKALAVGVAIALLAVFVCAALYVVLEISLVNYRPLKQAASKTS